MHIKRKKRVKVFKSIITNEPFDKYLADTVELNQRLIINDKFKYLITWVDYFSKYAWCFLVNTKTGDFIV